MRRSMVLAAASIALLVPTLGHADVTAVSFEAPSYSPGSIHGQNGWSSAGSVGAGCARYDHEVVTNGYGVPFWFEGQSLRISNARTSGCFGDQTFSKSLTNEAGESTAEGGGYAGGTRQVVFEANWEFASALPGQEQAGLSVVASPDRGDGARMSWIQMADTPAGLEVNFYEYRSGAAGPGCAAGNWVFTSVATGLDRSHEHVIQVAMAFVEGPNNDIVVVRVDETHVHVGTSWEGYYNECEGKPSRTVDSILFRTGGTAAPETLGKGFLIDNLAMRSLITDTQIFTCSGGPCEGEGVFHP